MAESTLKNYPTKQLEILMDYVEYLTQIRNGFVIGTRDSIYEPKYKRAFGQVELRGPNFKYELLADHAREMTNKYYKRLARVNDYEIMERAMRYRQLLSLDFKNPDSRARIMQLGYADELVRRKNELSIHSTLHYRLVDIAPAFTGILKHIEVMRHKSDESISIGMLFEEFLPVGELNDEMYSITERNRKLEGLIEREERLLEQKKQELDEMLETCYRDSRRELIPNFHTEKNASNLLLCERRRELADHPVCQCEGQYRDDEANVLRGEVGDFLKNSLHIKYESRLHALCCSLIKELSYAS